MDKGKEKVEKNFFFIRFFFAKLLKYLKGNGIIYEYIIRYGGDCVVFRKKGEKIQ